MKAWWDQKKAREVAEIICVFSGATELEADTAPTG